MPNYLLKSLNLELSDVSNFCVVLHLLSQLMLIILTFICHFIKINSRHVRYKTRHIELSRTVKSTRMALCVSVTTDSIRRLRQHLPGLLLVCNSQILVRILFASCLGQSLSLLLWNFQPKGNQIPFSTILFKNWQNYRRKTIKCFSIFSLEDM